MSDYHLADSEAKFAELIWSNEPITSGRLVKLCAEQFGWKSTTVYTVLRRLCDRGLFCNNNSVVTSLVSREDFCSQKSRDFVEHSFGGSLPCFISAFMNGRKLTAKQADEIRRLIDTYSEEDV